MSFHTPDIYGTLAIKAQHATIHVTNLEVPTLHSKPVQLFKVMIVRLLTTFVLKQRAGAFKQMLGHLDISIVNLQFTTVPSMAMIQWELNPEKKILQPLEVLFALALLVSDKIGYVLPWN